MRFILSILAVAALALSVLAGCQSSAKQVQVETTAAKTDAAPKKDEHGHSDDAPRITLADATKEFDAGTAIFVDTRAESAYKQEHIKGAINIPAEAMEMRYKEIPTNKKIIAYCS